MKKLFVIIGLLLLCGTANAESYLYLSQEKQINGSYKYCIPKLELNQVKKAGVFFGNKCNYLSEFEGSLVYTAPRGNMSQLNHHSVRASWNFGVEVGPFFATYSLDGIYNIRGNDDGLPEGFALGNTAKFGISWK